MELDFQTLVNRLLTAGQGLGEEVWQRIEIFAVPELKKIAVQIVDIGKNIDIHGLEGAKILLQMQIDASLGIMAGMTELTRLALQNAINAILDAVREFVNGAVGVALL